MATVQSICRYPIKGLSPEPLARAVLTPGQTVPGDRLYAIENGPSGFDAAAPRYLSKQHFLMLMKNERLAALRTRFDQTTHVLTIDAPPPSPSAATAENRDAGHSPRLSNACGDLRDGPGRAAIEAFFARYCADELRGPPKVLQADNHSFSDLAKKVVSIINLSSVSAVEDMVGVPVDPLRFRANLYVDGWPAWSELDLVGRTLRAGTARLQVVKRIVRCAATNVDPATGRRDLDIPPAIARALGHRDCGIYAEVIEAGEIAPGGEIGVA